MYFKFAWRYFKAKKSTNAINVISWVSVTAIVVGTASLIIVLSVFNGLEDLVKSLYSSFYTDITISPRSGKFITFSQGQLSKLSAMPDVKGYSLIAEDKAFIQSGSSQSSIISLKGVDSHYRAVAGVAGRVIKGKFDLGTEDRPGAVLGQGIENALGIESDRSIMPLSVYLFKKGNHAQETDLMESVSNENLLATGTFAIQEDFDNKYVITNIAFVKKMLGLQADEYSALEIALTDPNRTAAVQATLQAQFGAAYQVLTRYQQNQSLYAVMRMEKWVIYVVLSMILVVAAFNMVGSLTMLVLEKQKDIQVLKAMGADNGYIQKIFLSEGVLLAFLGGGTGILLAVVLCWLQVHFKLVPLQGQGGSFLIDYYPVKLAPGDFLLVLGNILIVALFASWFPSRKASMQPIELKS